MEHSSEIEGKGTASRGATNGAHGTLAVLWMGRARPYPGSRVPHTRTEEGVRGKEGPAQSGCVCGAGRGKRELAAVRRSGRCGQTGPCSSMRGMSGHAHLWKSGR
jgi:hypothetical protein